MTSRLEHLFGTQGLRAFFLWFFHYDEIFAILPLVSTTMRRQLYGDTWSDAERQSYAHRFLIHPLLTYLGLPTTLQCLEQLRKDQHQNKQQPGQRDVRLRLLETLKRYYNAVIFQSMKDLVQATEEAFERVTGTASTVDYSNKMSYHPLPYSLVRHGPNYTSPFSEEILSRFQVQTWTQLQQRFPHLGDTMEKHRYELDLWALSYASKSCRWKLQEELYSFLHCVSTEPLTLRALPHIWRYRLDTSFVLPDERGFITLSEVLPWLYARVGVFPSWVHELLYEQKQGHLSRTQHIQLSRILNRLQNTWTQHFVPSDIISKEVRFKVHTLNKKESQFQQRYTKLWKQLKELRKQRMRKRHTRYRFKQQHVKLKSTKVKCKMQKNSGGVKRSKAEALDDDREEEGDDDQEEPDKYVDDNWQEEEDDDSDDDDDEEEEEETQHPKRRKQELVLGL